MILRDTLYEETKRIGTYIEKDSVATYHCGIPWSHEALQVNFVLETTVRHNRTHVERLQKSYTVG